MSDWESRLQAMRLTSPSGQVFTPGWKADEQIVDLNVGQYGFPGVQGTRTQPMAADGAQYPLTLYFEGEDNDRESKRFLETIAKELSGGPWTVIHPVDGILRLQPVGQVKRPIDPTTSGNLTVVTTAWIVPLEDAAPASAPILAAEIEATAAELRQAATETLEGAAQKTASQTASIASAVKSAMATVKRAIAQTNARILALQNQINSVITGAEIDMGALAGGLINIITAPGLILGSINQRVRAMVALGKALLAQLPGGDAIDVNDRNTAIVVEAIVDIIISTVAADIRGETPETRAQALALMAAYNDFADEAAAVLDDVASRSSGNLEDRYYPSRTSAQALAALRSRINRYLLGLIGDLKTEQWYTLDRPRAPIMLAIEHYKATPANVDDFYRLFCRTNHLHGRRLLLLPAGTRYVVYA